MNTYLEYNPEGNYMDICFLGVGKTEVPKVTINNNYWEDSFKILHMEAIHYDN